MLLSWRLLVLKKSVVTENYIYKFLSSFCQVCVEEGTPEATRYSMFQGNYTIDKCLATCLTKSQISRCGALYNVARNQLRYPDSVLRNVDDFWKRSKMSRTSEEVKTCMKDFKILIDKEVTKCSHSCPTPCVEVIHLCFCFFAFFGKQSLWSN